jgi:hypothetical protein
LEWEFFNINQDGNKVLGKGDVRFSKRTGKITQVDIMQE